MRRAAIVSPVRTAVGTFGGSLRPVPVEELAATVIKAVLQRSGLDPSRVEDVVMAQSYASSETPCVGRWAALQAGLPIEVPGMQLDLDHLHRISVVGLEVRAQAFVPSHDFIQAPLQHVHLQRTAHPLHRRDVIERRVGFQLVQKPQPSLRK